MLLECGDAPPLWISRENQELLLCLGFGFWDLELTGADLELTAAAVSMGENNPGGLSDCDSAVRIRVAPEGNR